MNDNIKWVCKEGLLYFIDTVYAEKLKREFRTECIVNGMVADECTFGVKIIIHERCSDHTIANLADYLNKNKDAYAVNNNNNCLFDGPNKNCYEFLWLVGFLDQIKFDGRLYLDLKYWLSRSREVHKLDNNDVARLRSLKREPGCISYETVMSNMEFGVTNGGDGISLPEYKLKEGVKEQLEANGFKVVSYIENKAISNYLNSPSRGYTISTNMLSITV